MFTEFYTAMVFQLVAVVSCCLEMPSSPYICTLPVKLYKLFSQIWLALINHSATFYAVHVNPLRFTAGLNDWHRHIYVANLGCTIVMHYSLARICLCIAANLRFHDPCTIVCSVVDAFTFSVVLHNDISCLHYPKYS